MRSAYAPRTSFVIALACIVGLTSGCNSFVNMMALPYFLAGQDSMIDPRVSLLKDKKDKKRIVVVTFASAGLRFGHDSIDDSLTTLLSANIMLGDERFDVIPARKVREWKDTNPKWYDMNLQTIGEYFDTDYVLWLEVESFSLNETKSQYLLQGMAETVFKIYDVNKQVVVHSEHYKRDYPSNRPVPLSDVQSEDQFRQRFLEAMARDISWSIVPHRPADEVSDM